MRKKHSFFKSRVYETSHNFGLSRRQFVKTGAVFYTCAIIPQQVTKTKLDNNLYYCGGVTESGTPAFLETIRAQGVGKNDSYADPLFENLKPWSFKLKPDSPALKMGIKQIDLTGVGLTKDFPKQLMD